MMSKNLILILYTVEASTSMISNVLKDIKKF